MISLLYSKPAFSNPFKIPILFSGSGLHEPDPTPVNTHALSIAV